MRCLKLSNSILPILLFVAWGFSGYSQSKIIMDESVYSTWNRITGTKISNNGNYILYHLNPENGDQVANIYNASDGTRTSFERFEGGMFLDDSRFAIFTLKPGVEDLREKRRKNKKKNGKDLAKDSLAIVQLSTMNTTIIPDVESCRTGDKWGGFAIYKLEAQEAKKDSSEDAAKQPKESRKNGTKLIVRHLESAAEDTLSYVTHYVLAEENPGLLAFTTGKGNTKDPGFYTYDFVDREWHLVYTTDYPAEKFSLNKDASRAALIVDASDSNSVLKTHELSIWSLSKGDIRKLGDNNSFFIQDGWKISQFQTPRWSDDGNRLLFGIRPPAIVQDTNLLEEEIVKVEVWNYLDGRLYTQQEVQSQREKERSYSVIFDVDRQSFVKLASRTYPETELAPGLKGNFAIGVDESKYLKYISWVGKAYKDLYKIDLHTGRSVQFAEKIEGNVQVSPAGKFFYWYSPPDSAWMAYDVVDDKMRKIAHNGIASFFDEINDRPQFPGSNGYAGWTENDEFILVYDRYDLWRVDPKNEKPALRLTRGAEEKIVFRNIPLDPDREYIDLETRLLLSGFDERDKSGGYAWLEGNQAEWILKSDHRYSRRVVKARDADKIYYTSESFRQFPDIMLADLNFNDPVRVSNANPTQEEYLWGDAQIVDWVDFDGNALQGLLFTPENFDPSKKYPLLVNFYEKNSNNLHAHRAPYAHRSTINYSFYVNRGYVIFNPDIYYKIGYPGESCFNAVISGVLALLDKGFIDKERIGVQGHSWGGYQIAHLLTKTDLFRCAESGAPVVNMISAYGGIRWGSGMSRMFQYEKAQSRIGGTLWEKPELYLENSPIFNLHRQNTPVLILHNDEDTAVPWYQGIEYFVALRRLGKPAWMLNYNGEPHWPLKWQNRLDFNIRMQQFFDHYLMDAPMPMWMKEGIPAIEKGITKGYELTDEKN